MGRSLRRWAVWLAGLCVAVPALAQPPRYEPPAARLPAGTRALAMGGAFVVGRGSETIFYNPAQLLLQPGVSASVQRYEAASTQAALSAANAIGGRFGYGVGVTLVEYSTPPPTPPICPLCDPGPQSGIPASSLTAAIGATARVIGIRWGVAAKYIGEHIENVRRGTVALDVGAGKEIGIVSLGIAAQNLGADFDVKTRSLAPFTVARAELPRRATIGASVGGYAIGTWLDLGGNAAVSVLRDGFVVPMGGAELTYAPLEGWAIDLRAGVRRVRGESGEKPLTLGGGVSLDRFSLDYALERFSGGVTAHRVGVRVR